jgi:hypothetical protein
VFIELTDHLRCPADHDEAFLVLMPDRLEQRSVLAGVLGCLICDRRFVITDGAADLTLPDAPHAPHADTRSFQGPEPSALHAFLGLSGPGGYAVLVGDVAEAWAGVAAAQPGVALVAINPPPTIPDAAPLLSVLHADRLPIKSRSMRGVVLGQGYGSDAAWVAEAMRVTLPGLRVAGAGEEPCMAGLELLASADGWWVAQRTNAGL